MYVPKLLASYCKLLCYCYYWSVTLFTLKSLFIYVEGYLNEWIENSQKLGHQVFLGADSQFLDAVTDPDLNPLSQDKWNLWIQCSDSEKGKVHPSTGLRTDLNLSFDRPHPKSLLPELSGDHILVYWPQLHQSGRKSCNESCQDMSWSGIKVSLYAMKVQCLSYFSSLTLIFFYHFPINITNILPYLLPLQTALYRA